MRYEDYKFVLEVYDSYNGWDIESRASTLEEAKEVAERCYPRSPWRVYNEDTMEGLASGGPTPDQADHSAWLQRCPY